MTTNPSKQPHLVFISPYCALDLKSGASQSVRGILQAMTSVDWKASSFTGNCQDTPNGLHDSINKHSDKKQLLIAQDKLVKHHIYQFSNHQRALISAREENAFYQGYCQFLDKVKPSHILTFGGLLSERLLSFEARRRSIKSLFYLANPNYQKAHDFFNHFDQVLTDSKATAELYRDKIPNIKVIGKFIDPDRIVSKTQAVEKKYVTFINPSPEKGVEVVLKIISQMQADKDIQFLIVESRGTWQKTIRHFGFDATSAKDQIRVIPFQSNMANIYAQTKVLLLPSLWHESGPRVAVEAILNDIPVIGFNSGGTPEIIGDTGCLLEKPEVTKTDQYRLPKDYDVSEWVTHIRKLMRMPDAYEHQKTLIQNQKLKFDLNQRAKALSDLLLSIS